MGKMVNPDTFIKLFPSVFMPVHLRFDSLQ